MFHMSVVSEPLSISRGLTYGGRPSYFSSTSLFGSRGRIKLNIFSSRNSSSTRESMWVKVKPPKE